MERMNDGGRLGEPQDANDGLVDLPSFRSTSMASVSRACAV